MISNSSQANFKIYLIIHVIYNITPGNMRRLLSLLDKIKGGVRVE